MDYFGINSADELPRLKEVYADPVVEPTIVGLPEEREPEQEKPLTLDSDASFFSVTERGELIEGEENGGSTRPSPEGSDPSA